MTRRLCEAALCGAALVLLTGCPMAAMPTGEVPYLDTTGNNSIKDATDLPQRSTEEWEFTGAIDNFADIDVYALGTLQNGARLTVTVEADESELDPAIGIFDANSDLIAFNDDRNAAANDYDSVLDIVVPAGPAAYFLSIAPFQGGLTEGAYRVTVTVDADAGATLAQGQIVFLDWDGGRLDNPALGSGNLPPFDATQVGFQSSQTEELKDRIYQVVRDRYAGYDLTLLNSDDHAVPTLPHSTIHFGGNNAAAFGLAEDIDAQNQNKEDDAIIFVTSFRGAFTRSPTLDEMAVAIGNTVAHEIGHLLGLVHTHDCRELMDATCSNDALLFAQEFDRAPIDAATFPLGYQDAAELMEWLLGVSF